MILTHDHAMATQPARVHVAEMKMDVGHLRMCGMIEMKKHESWKLLTTLTNWSEHHDRLEKKDLNFSARIRCRLQEQKDQEKR